VPAAGASDAADEEDTVVLPISISLPFTPCVITSADGRSETVHTPIPGFEHLFKPAEAAPQRTFCTGIGTDIPTTARQPTDRMQLQTSGEMKPFTPSKPR
jgi:hypothetical protein